MRGKIRTIIIDDEENIVASIKNLIHKYCPELEIIGSANDLDSGSRCILEQKPDLVFLDIRLPKGDGFCLLENIAPIDFEVVFITAYDQYAMQAFDFSALHYILKPVNYKQLQDVVKRYKRNHTEPDPSIRLETMLHNLHKKNKRILLALQSEIRVIEIDDIYYCESSSNYTIFHLENEKIVVSKPLAEYDKMLASFSFYRIHTSYLINLNYIKSYLKGRGGYVLMKNNKKLDVATRKKQNFITILENHYTGLETIF